MTIIAVKMYVFEQKPLHAPVVEVLRARLPYDGQRIVVHDFVRLDREAPIARTGPQPHIGLLGIYHPAAVVGLRIPHGTDDSHFGFPVEDFQQFVRPVAAVARDDDEFVHHGQYRPHALHHRKVVRHRIFYECESAYLHGPKSLRNAAAIHFPAADRGKDNEYNRYSQSRPLRTPCTESFPLRTGPPSRAKPHHRQHRPAPFRAASAPSGQALTIRTAAQHPYSPQGI